jgi:hypothetical protein
MDELIYRAMELAAKLLDVPHAGLLFSVSKRGDGGWVAEVRRLIDPERKAIQAYGYSSPEDSVQYLIDGLSDDLANANR